MSEDNGRRWYDPNRVTLILGALVLGFVAWWGSLVYGMSRAAELANTRQDQELDTMRRGVEKMDGKLDRLLERREK